MTFATLIALTLGLMVAIAAIAIAAHPTKLTFTGKPMVGSEWFAFISIIPAVFGLVTVAILLSWGRIEAADAHAFSQAISLYLGMCLGIGAHQALFPRAARRAVSAARSDR